MFTRQTSLLPEKLKLQRELLWRYILKMLPNENDLAFESKLEITVRNSLIKKSIDRKRTLLEVECCFSLFFFIYI